MTESNKQNMKFSEEPIQKYREWFDQSRRASEIWRIDAKEDFSFVEGYGQWDESQKAELIRQKRPALVMNVVLPTINLISGQERQSRLGISYKPRGLDDDRLAGIANSSFSYMSETTELPHEVSHSFTDMIICGLGYLCEGLDPFINDDDPVPEISYRRIHPLSVFRDPSSSRYNMQDSKYIIHAKWMDIEMLKLYHPEAMSEIHPGDWLTVPPDQLGEKVLEEEWRNTRTGQVRVLEIWHKVPTRVWIHIMPDGSVMRHDSKKAATKHIDILTREMVRHFQPVPEVQLVERLMNKTMRTDITYWKILYEGPSPYKHNLYPFIPFQGYTFDERIMGAVRALKDPQREKNKRWSQLLHIVNTMAKGGWKIPKGSVSPQQLSTWGQESGKPGFFFEYNPQVGEPREIQGQNLPSSFIDLMQVAENEVRNTSGAIQELMGLARSGDQSGKAAQVFQRSGATILAPLYDNLTRSQKLLGPHAISMIRQFYPASKIIDLIGETDRQKLLETESDVMGFINDAMDIRYDTVVDVSPLFGSHRDRQFTQVMSLIETMAKSGFPPTPGLLGLLMKVSDFPDKEQLMTELSQAQPAGPANNEQGGG